MVAMFQIDDKQIIEYEKDLKVFGARAFPFATKSTLNSAAFATQKTARTNISNSMIERNKFTRQSVQVDMVKGLNVRTQESVIGSTQQYMEDQEFGETIVLTGKRGVAIPTSYAAGLGENAQPRTKLPTKPNKLQNIMLKRRKKRIAKTNKQQLLFKVQDAVASGSRYFYHSFPGGKTEGIFRVVGGRKNFKRGWPTGAQLKMVYDLSRKSVRVPINPWLVPAVIATERKLPKFYKKSLEFQLRRLGLFK